jgi:PBP1b-binding outer membrane lipoprotein LpoB
MMRKKRFPQLGIILMLFIVVTGCGPSQATEELAPEVPVETEQPTVPPTLEVTATAAIDEPTQEAEETENTEDNETEDVASVEQNSACVECHTNQAMLIDTADPVEEVESENEGAG